MSTTRTARRIITLSASIALIATAPGLVGVASANDTPSPTVPASNAQMTLSPALVTAIQDARNAFKASARTSMDVYRTAKTAIHTAMEADANLASLHSAKDAAKQALRLAFAAGTSTPALQAAYDNAKGAYDIARATYAAQEDAARTALQASVDAAKVIYVAAVRAAFTTYAPTVAVPANLLEVSGRHHGFAFGHLDMKPGNGHAGGHAKLHHAASLPVMGSHR